MGYVDLVKGLNAETATKRLTTEDRIAARKKTMQQIKDAIAKLQVKSKQATGSAVGKKKRRDAIAVQIREKKRKLAQHKEAIAKLEATVANRRNPKKTKETASRKYYILVEWVPSSNRWSMEFGDYDRQTVVEEMVSHKDSGSKTKNMRVVSVNDDGQKAIDAYMRGLNQEEPNGPTKK